MSNDINLFNIDFLQNEIKTDSIDLIIADPPYYKIINEKWDKQWKIEEEYLDWCKHWFDECVRVLKNTGSFYCYGSFDILSKQKVLIFDKQLNFRQNITFNKGIRSIAGRTSNKLKMFPTASEYLLFYTKQKMTITSPFEIIMKNQMIEQGIKTKQIQILFPSKTGRLTGCVFNWLNSLELPTEQQWNKICKLFKINANNYWELYKIYQNNRFTFNLPIATTDVWDFIPDRIRYGHPTQKPLDICQRIIKANSNEGDNILIPFCGSGSEVIACKKLNRNVIAYDINNEYLQITKNRLSACA